MISETKTDDSFATRNFLINRFNAPFSLDQNANGGEIMFYLRENILENLLGPLCLI